MGSNLDVTDFGGLQIVKYDSALGPPTAMNFTQNSTDTYKFLEYLVKAAETLSGVNSVSRGNPEASLKSGSALALVQAQALQFSIGLQRAWVRFLEDTATGTVEAYQAFAEEEQMLEICGVGNRGFTQTFNRSDLDKVSRVTVDIGNPLQRTIAGRIQIADMLGSKGLLKTPEEYLQVLTTGRLEPVLEATQKELLAVRSENERMAGNLGSPVMAVITDNHPIHMREHASVIASPDAREDPQVVQGVLAHIQEHIMLWTSMPPALGMALQIAPPPMMMAPPEAPGVPPAGAGPEAPMEPEGPQPQMPQMPQMPRDPITNERVDGPPEIR
jgi:hypothetical protein